MKKITALFPLLFCLAALAAVSSDIDALKRELARTPGPQRSAGQEMYRSRQRR